jgi:hypothetical protein
MKTAAVSGGSRSKRASVLAGAAPLSMSRLGRRLVTALCIAAALLLPLGAELHALGHALAALQKAHQTEQGTPPAACDECLLFASIGGALPAQAAALPLAAPEPVFTRPDAPPARADPFSAYASRAPPQRG